MFATLKTSSRAGMTPRFLSSPKLVDLSRFSTWISVSPSTIRWRHVDKNSSSDVSCDVFDVAESDAMWRQSSMVQFVSAAAEHLPRVNVIKLFFLCYWQRCDKISWIACPCYSLYTIILFVGKGSGLYYRHNMIVDYVSSIVNKFGASLAYNRHMFRVEETEVNILNRNQMVHVWSFHASLLFAGKVIRLPIE